MGSALTMTVQICFSIILMLTYPVCLVLCREYVESIIVLVKAPKSEGKTVSIDPEDMNFNRVTSMIIALVLMGLTLPFLFNDAMADFADASLEVFGSAACGIMAFVMPPFLYWKVFGWSDTTGKRSFSDKYLTWAIFVAGIIITVAGTLIGILDAAEVIKSWPQAPQMTPTS